MRKFIGEIGLFTLLLLAIVGVGILMPATPRASGSFLFAKKEKDQLLDKAPSPRIIFVGGSSVSFGLNSYMIKDSLNLNPINTGIVGGIGLRYMLDNTLQYVKRGDIVIVAPEYGRFYVKTGECLSPLLRTILDVKKSDIRFLRWRQYFSFITGLPTYVFSKFRLREYVFFSESDVYGVDSFNEYGDASAHWNLKRRDFFPYKKSPDEGFNDAILQDLKAFEEGVKDRGAIMMVSYPGLQDISFENIFEKVARVEKEYTKAGFRILGSPHRYKMPDSLMFDTPYHLSKRGVDRRTALFIEDFKSARQLSY